MAKGLQSPLEPTIALHLKATDASPFKSLVDRSMEHVELFFVLAFAHHIIST